MSTRYFCPRCWTETGEKADRCGHCGYVLKDFDGLSYQEKLIMALHHPVREHRMMAIRILGNLGSPDAVPSLGHLLCKDRDYYVIREIIDTLIKIGGAGAFDRIKELQDHPSKMIRKLADGALRRMPGDKKP